MILQGKGVSKGLAIGRVYFVDEELTEVRRYAVTDTDAELKRLLDAKDQAVAQLAELAESAAERLGDENAQLFEIHQMMLEDEDFLDAAKAVVTDTKSCAEYALWETAKEFSQSFAEMDDSYMKARAADVLDIGKRVVNILLGRETSRRPSDEPVILAAKEFVPSETAQMSRETTLALLTVAGAASSHTAIFARTMGIPAVIQLGDALDAGINGKLCVVDGESGIVTVDPDEAFLAEARRRQEENTALRHQLEQYRNAPTRTKSGREIQLYANIGSVQDAVLAMENGAQGVGLFRSEFLYLEQTDYPDEETQFQAYKSVLETMEGRQVIIRTLDIGADKQAAYFQLPHEENPALGLRGLRICLTRPEVFKTQLRAIYRASAFGNAAIMLPMVTSLWEVQRAQEIAAEVREALSAEQIAYDPKIPIGIMIETPAAAVISDRLAPAVDFFSIGSNDLIQYTLAVDRQNNSLGSFYAPHHEAVLRLIHNAINNAHAANIWCGICGDLGADAELTARFLEMGIDELSVAPPAILPLRKLISEME